MALLVIALTITGIGVVTVLWWQEAPLREAEAALETGKAKQALRIIDGFLRDHPGHHQALSLQARALVSVGEPTRALDIFERIGGSTPVEMHAWAQALLQLERWNAALPILEYLEQTGVDRADVLHELAACRAKVGDFDGAVAAATSFASLPGFEARGNLLLGTIHNERGNVRQAAAAWETVLEHAPDAEGLQIPPAEFFLEYGRTLNASGVANLAARYLTRSIQLQPQADAYVALGDSQTQLGETEAAETAYRKALALAPSNRQARVGLAQLQLARGDAETAKDWLLPVTRSDLTSQVAFLMQQVSVRLGETDEAERWRDRADELRRTERAREAAMQVLRDVPESSWAQVLRAYRFAENGNWSEAEFLLKPITQSATDQPFIQELYQAVRNRSQLPSLEGLPLHEF